MKRIQIAFLGDIMLWRGVNEEIGVRSPKYFWGDTLPILQSVDFVMGNLECVITEHKTQWQKKRKRFFISEPIQKQLMFLKQEMLIV